MSAVTAQAHGEPLPLLARIDASPVNLPAGQDLPDGTATGAADAPAASSGQISGPVLRPYQSEIIERARHVLTAGGKRRIIIVASTGAGKTVIASQIILNSVDKGLRALFLVHRRELLQQAAQKLHAVGIDAGIIAPGFPSRPDQAVQVASIPTLHSRAIKSSRINLPEASLLVVDECHHSPSSTWRMLIDSYPDAYVVGLTATPCRGDGRGLGGIFEELVECPDVPELVEQGYLVGTKVYAAPPPDLTGVKITAGDYNEKQLSAKMDQVQLVGDVVTHWLKFSEGKRTLVYAVDVAHSVHLRDEFCRAGILAEHIDGKTPAEERDDILRRFGAGSIDVVCNCAVLTEGFDCPDASCIVLAKPTKSFGLYRQMVGRGLRPAPGKSKCIVIDHAGLSVAHGFVDEPVEWALALDRQAHRKKQSGGAGTPTARKLLDCPECGGARWQGKPCPACGWRGHRDGHAVDFVDAELAELDREKRAITERTAQDPQRFYRQLLWIADSRGYARGWAAHKYRKKFGTWPTRRWEHEETLAPDAAVTAWVRSRQIAWAKAREKAGVSM